MGADVTGIRLSFLFHGVNDIVSCPEVLVSVKFVALAVACRLV